jgi:hypothetical protein
MVRFDDPGPEIVSDVGIKILPLVRVMVWPSRPESNDIVSPEDAFLIASRNDPDPLSFVFVTVIVDAAFTLRIVMGE